MGARLAVAAPPLFVCAVITFTYVVFVAENAIPQYKRATGAVPSHDDPLAYTPTVSEWWWTMFGFHLIFVLTLISFARSAFVAPGHIPRTEYWRHGLFNIPSWAEEKLQSLIADTKLTGDALIRERPFLKSLAVVERKAKDKGKKEGKLRFCQDCCMYKPDRTHHCKHCRQCVLRMDHHCPWIANCVGFNNYKHFLLFLFYASASCLFLLVDMFPRLLRAARPITDTKHFLEADLPVIIAYAFALFLFIALFWFFLVHMDFVLNCLTTIELREKKNHDDELVKHRWEVSHQKFENGSGFNNFLHVFGSAWMWLLPIQSDLSGTDGTYSEVPELTKTVEV